MVVQGHRTLAKQFMPTFEAFIVESVLYQMGYYSTSQSPTERGKWWRTGKEGEKFSTITTLGPQEVTAGSPQPPRKLRQITIGGGKTADVSKYMSTDFCHVCLGVVEDMLCHCPLLLEGKNPLNLDTGFKFSNNFGSKSWVHIL